MDNQVYETYRLKRTGVADSLAAVMKRSNRLVLLRPLVFLAAAGLTMVFAFLSLQAVFLWGAGLLLLCFVIMLIKHNRIKARIKYLEQLIQLNDAAMQRLDGQWQDFSNTGERFMDREHRYTADLNIFGPGSLFQYLNAATSLVGEERLAGWLSAPAAGDEITPRQQAITELAPRLDWRQHFQTTGLLEGRGKPGNLAKLLAWAEEKPLLTNKYVSLLLFLPAVTLVLAVAGFFHWLPLLPNWLWILPLAVQIMIMVWFSKPAGQMFGQTENMAEEIRRWSALLGCIEPEQYDAALLRQLQSQLLQGGGPPSQRIKKLFAIIDRVSFRYSSIYLVINIGLLWDLRTLVKLEEWRAESGRLLRSWVEVIAAFEALASLAGLAYEHPHWTMPAITGAAPFFKAVALGHPLIKEETRVSNDVTLAEPGVILLITGSNMSGKSTLLRTVGINLVLAYAGAAVCAKELSCSRMNLYTSIHINDNLEKNISTFYAELQRIKLILDAAKSGEPTLFLIDEIFKGTNSKDRIIGAQAVIKNLNRLGAMGLVSTHDLELSRLEQEIPQIKNYHFTDQISGREISFDYRLKTGVSTSTNAIALMKIVGIQTDNS